MLAPPPTARWQLPFGQTYCSDELRRDMLAAMTVAAISLPQAMAYALLAGVDPRYGLYSAIVVTAVASLFGSSSHLINGPTSAISLVAPLARFVPKATLSALLLLTAARLIEPQRLLYTMRASRQDGAVLLITIVSALVFGLDVSILVGVALSILLYVSRASRLKCVELVVDRDGMVRERRGGHPPGGDFIMYDMEGDLFFGAALHFSRCLDGIMNRIENEGLRHVILRLKRVRNPDAVCLERLEQFLKACARRDVTVLLADVQPDLLAAADRLGFFSWYPQDRVYAQGKDEDSATLAAIRHLYRELPESRTATADADRRLYYLL